MFDFTKTIVQDLHPIVVHLPIALLLVSFVLSFAALRWTQVQESSWLLLVLGGLATIPAIATGVVAHLPYEGTSLADVIEVHQLLALGGSALTLATLGWRWWSRRRGRDVGTHAIYLTVVAAGLVWLVLLGGTGGQLTYGYGINVRSAPPVLP